MRRIVFRQPGGAAPLLAAVAVVVAPATASPVVAQERDLFLEVGASRVSPPPGVAGEAAKFVVGGIRGTMLSLNGSGVTGSVMGGRATDAAAGGDFLSGDVAAAAWRNLGGAWSIGVRGRALGYWVAAPLPYRAAAVEAGPSLRLLSPGLSLRLDGTVGVGRSRIEFESVTLEDGTWQHRRRMGERWDPERQPVTTRRVDSDLWRYGGGAELLVRAGPVFAGATGGAHRTAGGTFKTVGLRLIDGFSELWLGLHLDVWWTPHARETAGGLSLAVPLGGRWGLRGFVGRTEPDPLTLATSSGGGGGALLGRRIVGSAEGRRATPLHRVLSRTADAAKLRFSVRVPQAARVVELVGDFSLWEPHPMERTGGEWVLEIEVPEGLHHFGFLVDGAWFVPDGAADTVPDEWGRQSVLLLVEPAEAGEDGGTGR